MLAIVAIRLTKMKTYCIYTNTVVDIESTTPEHIIPLSLGGCNEFTIPVERAKNAEVGSRVDGKFANDFFISLIRKHKDYRGHSNKPVTPSFKKSKVNGSPIQVKFVGDTVEVYDPIARKTLTQSEVEGLELESAILLNQHVRIIFVAKVLLAAGYFTYREVFRDYADHESLRKLMNLGLNETTESLKSLPLKVVDPVYCPIEATEYKPTFELINSICVRYDNSCVIFTLGTENIVGTVAIGGELIGQINFEADITKFPDVDDMKDGHAIGIKDGKLQRDSYKNLIDGWEDVVIKEAQELAKNDPSIEAELKKLKDRAKL